MGVFDEITVAYDIPELRGVARTFQFKDMPHPSMSEYTINEKGQMFEWKYDLMYDHPMVSGIQRLAFGDRKTNERWEPISYTGTVTIGFDKDDGSEVEIVLWIKRGVLSDWVVETLSEVSE